MSEPTGTGGEPPVGAEILTFLIADVRGYTLFTQERGDEAAAKLAAKFARIAREEIAELGGKVIELRGDEALAVFVSPRQALRAALQLQERFVDETLADPDLPLTVGIGLDAGEAVPVEGGYRGGALNLAARLCGRAGPGEVLSSGEVTHLARRIDGVRYLDRGAHEFKGLTDPVRVIKVEPETGDPALRLRPAPPTPGKRRRGWLPRSTRGRVVAAAMALALVASAVGTATLLRNDGPRTIGPGALGLIDLESGSIVESVAVAVGRGGLAAGAGAIWAAGTRAGTVLRIDPETRAVVDTIDVGGEASGIAVGEGFVWVAVGDQGQVVRVNPSTNEVVGRPIRTGNGPAGVAVGDGSVWVANSDDASVSRIRAEDPEVAATRIPVAANPAGVALTRLAVWVTNSASGSVSRIDPSGEGAVSVRVGNGPSAIAASEDGVWIVNEGDGTVSRIDPARNAVVATVEVAEGPVAVALAGGDAWVASEVADSVTRIDGNTNRVAQVLPVGGSPRGLVVHDGAIWVATGPQGAGGGGTFTIVSEERPLSIDPGVGYWVEEWVLLLIMNDGLVGYRKVGGAGGNTIVPNLATSLPEPTDGGRTYAFTLRRGIRYSSGGVVKAGHVRASLERAMSAEDSPSAFFFDSIAGAETCEPGACDLSPGIETNDQTGSVTFHLSHPDPDFLYKLATPPAFVLPEDVPPAGSNPDNPLPATGPYMLAETTASGPSGEGVLEFVRNPVFREWSRAAQPAGNLDRIVWRFGLDPAEMVDMVRDGEADWMPAGPPLARVDELRTRHSERLHDFPQQVVHGMAMNTRVPPFDDPRVRRAVNFAVDRRVAAEFFGEATVTCQILPPNFPGYRPYCPYQRGEDPEAPWDGPDLQEAHRLIREAGAEGAAVTVSTRGGDGPEDFVGLGRYVVTVLQNLGLRARLRVADSAEDHFATASDSSTRTQIFAMGWAPDYKAASNFLDMLFHCDRFMPNEPFQTNYSQLCDQEVDRLIERAFRLQVEDPSAAADAWAEVDRAVVDTGAWLPIANPIGFDFVSERVGNYQRHPQWGLLFAQVTVR